MKTEGLTDYERIRLENIKRNDEMLAIDFNPENTNIMATSSSDKTACIWDLRKLSKSKPEFVKLVAHKRVVYSAYFSPSGSFLATTR